MNPVSGNFDKMKSRSRSQKKELIEKSRESILAAVQIYNNPFSTFKSESYIVLSIIGWTYLLHSYYRGEGIEYRYFHKTNLRKKFDRNPDGSIRYWDLKQCISSQSCPLDIDTINNLSFLIGLRNQIEHKKADGLDSYMSARYQACALNYNYYLKKLHGDKYGLDSHLALSLQFAEFDFSQAQLIKDKEDKIPKHILSFISSFDGNLSLDNLKSERYAYRLLFTKVAANRRGQADRVVEIIDPNSTLAQNISKEYVVFKDRKSKLYLAREVMKELLKRGKKISPQEHIALWKKYDGKNPSKGFGDYVGGNWYWYPDWIDFISNLK